jgi:hypothetical protein
MDIQVSLVRILIGDNSRTAPTYTDAQLRAAISLGPVRPPYPGQVLLAGVRAAHVYPSDVSGGPWTGS